MALPTEDIIAIQQLAARYNHAVDSGDGAGFAATFTEEGRLVAGAPIEGRAALAAFATGVPTRLSTPRHWVGNVVIDGDGDIANLKAYIQIHAMLPDSSTPTVVSSGTYNDTLRREDGRWLFVERVFSKD